MRGIVLSQVLSSHSKTLLPEVDNGLRVCPQAILLSALLLARFNWCTPAVFAVRHPFFLSTFLSSFLPSSF